MFIQKKEMKIVGLDQTRGTLETLLVLLRDGSKRPTDIISSISVSADTFYVVVKILKGYNLVVKQYDESLDALVWCLTDKGREIARFLDEIEKRLNR
jgi:predicted transcriptional regulator